MSVDFRKNWLSFLLIVVVVLMGVEMVYLIQQNRRLRSMVENPGRYFQPLKQDDTVPPFVAQDLDGNPVSVDYSPTQPYTVLLWFSPSCEACEENLMFWNELHRDYASENLRVLGISTDDPSDLRRVTAERGLAFPVLSVNDPSLVQAYKGNVLPQTVLVSPEGSIRQVWPGPLQDEHRESIMTYLAQIGTLTGKGGDGQ